MNILNESKTLIEKLKVPCQSGVFKNKAPDIYIVLTPLIDTFPYSADNMPQTDVQSLRITLYSKENYLKVKNKIVRTLIAEDFTITDRKFNGYEVETNYYQYTIDVEKNYNLEEE